MATLPRPGGRTGLAAPAGVISAGSLPRGAPSAAPLRRPLSPPQLERSSTCAPCLPCALPAPSAHLSRGRRPFSHGGRAGEARCVCGGLFGGEAGAGGGCWARKLRRGLPGGGHRTLGGGGQQNGTERKRARERGGRQHHLQSSAVLSRSPSPPPLPRAKEPLEVDTSPPPRGTWRTALRAAGINSPGGSGICGQRTGRMALCPTR